MLQKKRNIVFILTILGSTCMFFAFPGQLLFAQSPVPFQLSDFIDNAPLLDATPVPVLRTTLEPTEQPGRVIIDPQIIYIDCNKDFITEVLVNTGGYTIYAYEIKITFDPSIVAITSGIGLNGVEPGRDGYVSTVDVSEPGSIIIAGDDPLGANAGTGTHLATINWNAIAAGYTELKPFVNSLIVYSGSNIANFSSLSRVWVYENILGDVNSDDVINIIDALLVAQYYVGLNPDGFNPDMADVDSSSIIDIVDALLIAQYYVGLIDAFDLLQGTFGGE